MGCNFLTSLKKRQEKKCEIKTVLKDHSLVSEFLSKDSQCH